MTRHEYVKTVLEPRFKDELYHYGTPRHSGRYPYGSGKRPYQGNNIDTLRAEAQRVDKELSKAWDELNALDDTIDAEFKKLYPSSSNMSSKQITSAFIELEKKFNYEEQEDKVAKYHQEYKNIHDQIDRIERDKRLVQNKDTSLNEMSSAQKVRTLRDIDSLNRDSRDYMNSKVREDLTQTVRDMVKEYRTMGANSETWSYILDKYRPKVYELYKNNAREIVDNLRSHGVNVEKLTGVEHPVQQLMILKGIDDKLQNGTYARSMATTPFDELIDDTGIESPDVWMDWFDLEWDDIYNA